jgi:hypothetical protein
MSKLTLFNGIVADLKTIPILANKKVGLWNNQLEREGVEQAFLYPNVFIEFLPSDDYKDRGNTVQDYELTIRFHICFESYKDEDTTILTLIEDVYKKMHYKQYGTFGKIKRRSEDQNFDHSNVQDYMQDYITLGVDYSADSRPSTPAPNVVPVITTSIVKIKDNL